MKFTALDAVQLGFRTHLLVDACRGVNLKSGDVDRAIEEMRKAGVIVTDSRAQCLKRKREPAPTQGGR